MAKNKHLGLIIDPDLHYKLHYIAKYEGRSANGQILYLIRRCIKEFEAQNGEISYPENEKQMNTMTKSTLRYRRLRGLREDRDLTQEQIANFLKCDQSLYSKYERGVRDLPLSLAASLAIFYKTSVDYLIGLTNETKPYPRRKKH